MARGGGDGARLAVVALAAAVVALAGSWVWAHFLAPGAAVRRSAPRPIRVQVLNGSGEPRVGLRVAEFLRAGGYQVVEVRNADRGDYFATFVVARRADLSMAREVAHYLGGPPLVRQAWDSELADVTVLVGGDRSRLQLGP